MSLSTLMSFFFPSSLFSKEILTSNLTLLVTLDSTNNPPIHNVESMKISIFTHIVQHIDIYTIEGGFEFILLHLFSLLLLKKGLQSHNGIAKLSGERKNVINAKKRKKNTILTEKSKHFCIFRYL